MVKNLFILITFCLLSFTLSSNSHALRCGNEIIMRGDTAQSVLKKCGEPEKREYSREVINGHSQYVEKWFYNCGESDFLYGLIIIDSKVFKDDPFTRGYGANKCR